MALGSLHADNNKKTTQHVWSLRKQVQLPGDMSLLCSYEPCVLLHVHCRTVLARQSSLQTRSCRGRVQLYVRVQHTCYCCKLSQSN
jgi:hypothetical protein